MINKLFPSILIVLALSLGSSLPGFTSALLESAKEDFQLKRYHAAAETLNRVVTAEPSNPEGYYWLGRALEELKDRDGAKTMYMSAFRLNPFGPHAITAKQALMDLAAKQAALDHPTDGPEQMAQTLALIERQAGDWKQMKLRAGNSAAQYTLKQGYNQALNQGFTGPMQQLPGLQVNSGTGYNGQMQSIAAIRAQMRAQGSGANPYLAPGGTVQAVNPYTNVGNPSTATSFNNWGGSPGAAGGGTGYGAIAGTGGWGGAAGFGTPGAPSFPGAPANMGNPNSPFNPISVYGNQPVSNLATMNTSWIRSDSTTQALRRQQEAAQSALELQKSANNLEYLLGEKSKAGSPHLRSLGTNLFVRNYSEHDDDSLAPADPPLELKAKQERLEDLDKGLHAKSVQLKLPSPAP